MRSTEYRPCSPREIRAKAVAGSILRVLALAATVAVAYNSTGWYAAVASGGMANKHHYIGTFECYNCGRGVGFRQEKGKELRGVKSDCGNCGLTNMYDRDGGAPGTRPGGRGTAAKGSRITGKVSG